jgi:[ribosomal protein S5]-alanine N-acetyltransferase
MKIFAETERLVLREFVSEDSQGMFLLHSDPEVHTFLEAPIINVQQASDIIDFIREQYVSCEVGRWAVINKVSGDFLGWSGLKFITDVVNGNTGYYDLGYRFLKQHWGKGYATEAAIASVNYAHEKLQLKEVFAIADVRNVQSDKVLKKVGFRAKNIFNYQGTEHRWYTAAL